MKKNLGELDKTVRVLLASVVVVLNFMGHLGGVAATILMSLAAYLLLSSLAGFCVVYAVSKLSTLPKKQG